MTSKWLQGLATRAEAEVNVLVMVAFDNHRFYFFIGIGANSSYVLPHHVLLSFLLGTAHSLTVSLTRPRSSSWTRGPDAG